MTVKLGRAAAAARQVRPSAPSLTAGIQSAVIPAKAGIHVIRLRVRWRREPVGNRWIPAAAGMTAAMISFHLYGPIYRCRLGL
jgi:hypothetical protein